MGLRPRFCLLGMGIPALSARGAKGPYGIHLPHFERAPEEQSEPTMVYILCLEISGFGRCFLFLPFV